MKLQDIGFYTLSDNQAKNVSWYSDLQRCELILTDRCNFKCVYCRGVKEEYLGDLIVYITLLKIVNCFFGVESIPNIN
jgi:sulfatase maturation enzyme AslB (radical SAM superfamily)